MNKLPYLAGFAKSIKDNNLNQQKLGDAVGVTGGMIGNIINGRKKVSALKAMLIAKALNENILDLFSPESISDFSDLEKIMNFKKKNALEAKAQEGSIPVNLYHYPEFLKDQIKSDDVIFVQDTKDKKSDLNAYAYELHNDSLAPKFHKGDILVMNSNLKPTPGDIVMGLFDEDVVLGTFKQITSKIFEISPINKDWGTIKSSDGIELCGTFVQGICKT